LGSLLVALVLSVKEISESDLLVNFLSRERGRLSAVAKGARRSRRRFVNKLEPGHLLRIHLRKGRPGLAPFLEAADLLFAPEISRTDPRRFVLASYFIELCERSSPPAEGQEVFPLLLETLKFLEKESPPPILKPYFELRLLRLLGWSPEFRVCVACGKDLASSAYFSFAGGGLKCNRCAHEKDRILSPRARAVLSTLFKLSPESLPRLRIPEEVIREMAVLVESFLKKVLDQDIKALKTLKDLESHARKGHEKRA